MRIADLPGPKTEAPADRAPGSSGVYSPDDTRIDRRIGGAHSAKNRTRPITLLEG